jgi:hypothetical protein
MDALLPSLGMMTSIWMYNDLDGSSSSAELRNALNATGLMCFSWGGLRVLIETELTTESYAWILLTGLFIFTTIQAQDLPDKEGDLARNRQSSTIVYGDALVKTSLIIMVCLWTGVTLAIWKPHFLQGAVLLMAGGSIVAVCYFERFRQGWEEATWKLWCLWMCCVYTAPAFSPVSC